MGTEKIHTKLHKTAIDIPEKTRVSLVTILNLTLASMMDLKSQVKFAHWNVKGLQFFQLHGLFDELAGELEEQTDGIAERVTTLGGVAMGTLRFSSQQSTIPEYPLHALSGEDHLRALSQRYAMMTKMVRNYISESETLEDAVTADILTGIGGALDKRLWFIEAHLQEG